MPDTYETETRRQRLARVDVLIEWMRKQPTDWRRRRQLRLLELRRELLVHGRRRNWQ